MRLAWVQAYAPEINRRCRQHLKPTNRSYRVDETYINVKGQDRYLYHAVDSTGQKRQSCVPKFLQKLVWAMMSYHEFC